MPLEGLGGRAPLANSPLCLDRLGAFFRQTYRRRWRIEEDAFNDPSGVKLRMGI
jgi:hypothetical protein